MSIFVRIRHIRRRTTHRESRGRPTRPKSTSTQTAIAIKSPGMATPAMSRATITTDASRLRPRHVWRRNWRTRAAGLAPAAAGGSARGRGKCTELRTGRDYSTLVELGVLAAHPQLAIDTTRRGA